MENQSLTNQKHSGFYFSPLLLLALNLTLTGLAAYLGVAGSDSGDLLLYMSSSFLLWFVVILNVHRSLKSAISYVFLFVVWDFILTNQISLDSHVDILLSHGFVCQRLVIFVLIAACIFRFLPQIPFFITNIVLWTALFAYPTVDKYITVVSDGIIQNVFVVPLYETVAILIFGLLMFNYYIHRYVIQVPTRSISVFNACFHLVALGVALFACGMYHFAESTFIATLYTANGLIIVAVTLLLSATIAAIINTLFHSYQAYVEKAMSHDLVTAESLSAGAGMAIKHDERLIQLSNRHIERIQELQSSEEILRQKFTAAQGKADSLSRLNETLSEVANQSPIGQLMVAIDGTIIDANKKFTGTLNIPATLRGEEFNILNSGNAWAKEIWKIIDDLFTPKDGVKRTKSYKTYSLPVSGRYLEIDVHLSEHFGKIDRSRKKANTVLGVVIIIQEKLDIRQLQSAGYGKSRRYLAEKLALISCVESSEDLEVVKDALSQQKKLIQGARTQDNYARLKEVISSASSHFSKIFRKISPLTQYSEHDESNIKQYDLKSILKSTIGYVGYLTRLEADIPVKHSGQVQYSDNITVTLPERSLNSFLSDFVQLVKSMLEKNQNLEVFLDIEDLKAGELEFMPATASGQFVRITLKHEGKSITEMALSNNYTSIFNPDKELGELEVAAMLLANHIQELGGFTTLHNVSRKETIFSLYLPINYAQQAVHEKENTIDYGRKRKATSTVRICNALIIGQEHRRNKTLKRMLISIGAGAAIVGRGVVDESSDALDFTGQGFPEPECSTGIPACDGPDGARGGSSSEARGNESEARGSRSDTRSGNSEFAVLRKINLVIISHDDESEIDSEFIKTVCDKFAESKVVVLATDEAQAEKVKAENSEANLSVHTQPVTLDDLKKLVRL